MVTTAGLRPVILWRVEVGHTTVVVQRYLDELAGVPGDAPAEPIVRDLLASAVNRLHGLCATLLFRSYPRLTRPPLNLQADEMLSAVVERLLKAMRDVRPPNVRMFFALANRHMRWELNDLARRLDEQAAAVELRDSMAPAAPDGGDSELSVEARRILSAIDQLPDEEREVFNLVRVQGLSHPEAAAVLGVSPKTVQRRLNRSRVLLAAQLADLGPAEAPGRGHGMDGPNSDG
jgi:RNA polymerase sigma factor (sigma-70 family)